MSAPLVNLVVFIALCAAGLWLFLPNVGVIARLSRSKRTSLRIHTEDALKFLCHQEQNGQSPTLAALTAALDVGSAEGTATVERMMSHGLARIRDGRIVLTEEGRRYGLNVIRAHRLWERYLADETGVDPMEWHRRAERLEHHLSPGEANELAARLGHPRFDPHGDPIPTADGTLQADEDPALTELKTGDRAFVTHVEDEPDVVYAQLVACGIYPGMEFGVVSTSNERIVLEADGREVVLAPIMAANVSVRKLAADDGDTAGADATLSDLGSGEEGDVVRISPACRGLERRRLMDLGIVPGTRVGFERRGLTGGLTAFKVRGTVVALREEQARMIAISRVSEAS